MNRSGSTDPFIRNEREAMIATRSEKLGTKFAERAPRHDLEGSFPFENFDDLKESGYLKLTVPASYGGEEASVYEMVLAQERLARGDGSGAGGRLAYRAILQRAYPGLGRSLYSRGCARTL